MLDLELLVALATAILGVAYLALSCCGPPVSSKRTSHNQLTSDVGMATALEGTTSRKIKIVDVENINADVKEKTLDDERKEERKRRGGREPLKRPRKTRSKQRSTQRGDKRERPRKRKSQSPDDHHKDKEDKDASAKKEDKERGKKGEEKGDSEKNPLPLASSEPTTSKVGDSKQKSKESTLKGTEVDDSNKDSNQNKDGRSTYVLESPKAGGSASNEKLGTNETMFSRDRLDEIESAKLKREATSPNNKNGLSAEKTQLDSENVKKSVPSKPQKKVNRKKEEETRQWNEAVARGNVFRPRKDDETIDEVNVDWNGRGGG